MEKILDFLLLAVVIVLSMLWLTSPDAKTDEPLSITKTLRDEFVYPGMHAEWLDEKTVQCLKEKP
ncbi:hypothetical protein [Comamonas guangdongensis]|uniref:Uncharacterized protein n=1 Tax=Comamonas guangdongensis TaxID=510515 RepID=A0ABV3ZPQ1_9BURK